MSLLGALRLLADAPLTPGREADFEAFWYYTILGAGASVLVVMAAAWVFRAVRPMWRDGNRLTAVVVTGAAGFFCILFLAMAVTALVGATNHPATPPSFQLGSSG
jgi:zinc transporter ZupT